MTRSRTKTKKDESPLLAGPEQAKPVEAQIVSDGPSLTPPPAPTQQTNIERRETPSQVIVQQPQERPLTIEDLMLRAIDRGDTATMEKLYSMRREMQQEKAQAAFNAAMTKCQMEMTQVNANAVNPNTHSKYATYDQLDRALRPIYTRNGFALSFDTGDTDAPDTILVYCFVSHSDGHTKRYQVPMPVDMKGPKGSDVMTKTHATGSGMSYGMRYLLKLVFNVAVGETDDDGNGGGEMVKLTPGQVLDVNARITATGANRERFLAYMEVDTVEDIPAKRMGEAMNALVNIEKLRKEKERQEAAKK